jgi:glycyl-tRNA synthetase beta chain
MPDLIFEVGTEEMPANAVAGALEQLRASVQKGLADARLASAEVTVWGTPRRLIVSAKGIPERQPDQEREAKGPARSAAYDQDGKPTGAAIGFARKQGISVEQLETVSTPQGEYVLARVTDAGRTAAEVLGPILADSVKALTFPKMMRWGTVPMRFVRPIRWILCLLDSEVVPLEIAGVSTAKKTRGHRFLAPDEFEVSRPDELISRLREAFVLVDPEERRQAIIHAGNEHAGKLGGSIPWDDALIDENTWLVEWPTALIGGFDAQYLDLPRPVLVTAMKKHQRFFPVEDANGNLLPHFLSIRNGGTEHLDVVREGNERVLTARFADASYFFEQDRHTSLDDMAKQLDRLIFQEKLGTIAQKRERLALLAAGISQSYGLSPEQAQSLARAASVCKADLVSRMVIELPALQGVMGREYALASGESPEIADAIAEHYRPRSASDEVPASLLGRLLALADRLDTLVGYVGIGILPSGSSDPYGLRRAAQGVIQILADDDNGPSLVELEVMAARGYAQVNGLDFPLDPLCNDLATLFEQRLSSYLEDRGIPYDLVDAALSGGSAYHAVVRSAVRRAETLKSLAGDPSFVPTVQAAARVANILRSGDAKSLDANVPGKEGIHGGSSRSVERALSTLEDSCRRIDPNILADEAEKTLYSAAHALVPEVARPAAEYDYAQVYRKLQGLNPVVDRFFDDVMVMVPDAALRQNRLALLSFVDCLYKILADFTKVVVA